MSWSLALLACWAPLGQGGQHGQGGQDASPRQQALATTDLRIAVIGDYGRTWDSARDTATLVRGWKADYVLTLGDNNYPVGSAATIDRNVGQHYSDWIHPYQGAYGKGASSNRFFPALGNHDWLAAGAQPYLDYFELPGNERYYDVVLGPVHVFVLDSDPHEPDGRWFGSVQGQWLQAGLAASTAPFRFVTMHHAPYSSALHGSKTVLQWPFRAWGADAVFAGHDHVYERLVVGGLPYFVNGASGTNLYPFRSPPHPGSKVRFNADHGAILIEVSDTSATIRFVTRRGVVVDTHRIEA
jgi:hypothetical protein